MLAHVPFERLDQGARLAGGGDDRQRRRRRLHRVHQAKLRLRPPDGIEEIAEGFRLADRFGR